MGGAKQTRSSKPGDRVTVLTLRWSNFVRTSNSLNELSSKVAISYIKKKPWLRSRHGMFDFDIIKIYIRNVPLEGTFVADIYFFVLFLEL